MPKLKVEGIFGLDGEYEFPMPDTWTQNEWHEIKVRTGLRPLELEEAFEKGDVDTMAAIAWVSLTRSGHDSKKVWGTLGESNLLGTLTFDMDDREEEPVPPDKTRLSGVSDGVSGPGETGSSSGETTSTSLVSLESVLTSTGTQG